MFFLTGKLEAVVILSILIITMLKVFTSKFDESVDLIGLIGKN